MSADSCKTADHGKSSGYGVFLVGPQSKQAASEGATTNDGEVSPLSAFNECQLNLVNEDGSYTNGKFRDALSDSGNIILVLSSQGVTPKLTAIVHEDLDHELQDFRKYWPKGEIRINPDKSIYKLLGGKSNQARKLSVFQLLSWKSITGVYAQVWQAIRSGEVKGNLHKGNGFYLGGVIVTNKQKQLVYEWKQVYETLANVDEVREAALLINSSL